MNVYNDTFPSPEAKLTPLAASPPKNVLQVTEEFPKKLTEDPMFPPERNYSTSEAPTSISAAASHLIADLSVQKEVTRNPQNKQLNPDKLLQSLKYNTKPPFTADSDSNNEEDKGMKRNFQPAETWIRSENDLRTFINSKTYTSLVNFIADLSETIRGIPAPEYYSIDDIKIALPRNGGLHISERIYANNPPAPSSSIKKLHVLLDILDDFIKDFPPIQQAMRFGNTAFRGWLDHVKKECPRLITECLSEEYCDAAIEVQSYLLESFGNYVRIDYGTGHELAFCQFLYCLVKIGFFTSDDKAYLVLIIFKRYIKLMRNLQTQYMLEPAGSRGVWGLDDYHFLPFLWGASQLQNQEFIQPSDVIKEAYISKYFERYLYIDAIKFITETKKGVSFGECSPILYDISGVPSWGKVASGLMRMYQAEVLGKFPVMQHLRFGSIFPAPS